MARIPIRIDKINIHNQYSRSNEIEGAPTEVKYLINVFEKGSQWDRTFTASRDELIKFREEINAVLDATSTAETLRINPNQAQIVEEHHANDPLCQACPLKMTLACVTCLFTLQSPLERQLYLKLQQSYLRFQVQYPLNWKGENISIEGKTYANVLNNYKEVLTVVDFYFEKRDTKLCVYTDGHTYHERTEEQAQRDRRIDRTLQELGFSVLRYTGKDVREKVDNILTDIQKWLG